jgi:acyl-CoA thioester hydrolase
MLKSKSEIRVRYEETDQMGVVYHAKYFNWFEVGRINLLDDIGVPYKQLEEKGYFLPVLSCEAAFRSPAFFDDRLIIEVKVHFPTFIRMKADYEVKRGHNLIATGSTVHAFVSKEGKVVRPPAEFNEFIKKDAG